MRKIFATNTTEKQLAFFMCKEKQHNMQKRKERHINRKFTEEEI